MTEAIIENGTEDTKVVSSKIVCPQCGAEIVIERPAAQRRGQLAGLEISDMTDEQLKREKINASSVLYKATKRGAGVETISKNQARVDAVKAELLKRGIGVAATVVTTEVANQAETVYNPDVAEQM